MVNKVVLVGRVGKDPEIRHIQSGDAVANFTLTTSDKNKQGEKVETTEWHNIVLWKHLAEIVERYVHKGDLLYIEGKITHRSYDDRDGNKKYITEIVGTEIKMLGGTEKTKQKEEDDLSVPPPGDDVNDDLPF